MALTSGTRLGPYEIVSAIGAGGMGEVYRARDTHLKRDVAVKVLPEGFAKDPDRLARFQREAELLATLNHPGIAAIYGLEKSEGVTGIILELVEGETLAQQLEGISGSGLGIRESLHIARQICDALEAAHEKGVVHRDLKPANIKITSDGKVKVLDFGLAKMLEPGGSSGPGRSGGAGGLSPTFSPTLSVHATHAGVILGTAAYMSPEQARGKPIDRRTDIWAFGCVLYEMLTGHRAFEAGETVSDAIAAILRNDPDWSALPADVPDQIRLLLKRCLEKDRSARIGEMGTARFLMTETIAQPHQASAAGNALPPSRLRPVLLATGGLVVGASIAAAAAWWIARSTPPPKPQTMRFAIIPPTAEAIAPSAGDRQLAISPDGTHLAYISSTSLAAGQNQLMVRAIDQLEAVPIRGATSARMPFFSPDGKWIGYFEGNSQLMKVSISGGPPLVLCRLCAGPRGASWGTDDTIVFAIVEAPGLQSVPAGGGTPTTLAKPDAKTGETYILPSVLPDGHAVLFTIRPPAGMMDNAQVAVLDRRTGQTKILIRGGMNAEYVESGHLVYDAAAGSLRAVRFDPGKLEVLSDPVPVVDQVTTGDAAQFAVSRTGTLVYIPGGIASSGGLGGRTAATRTVVWVDRKGHEEAIAAPPRGYFSPRISPDGTKVALDSRDEEQDIWIFDLKRKTLTRLTIDPGIDGFPVWMTDGQRIIFESNRDGGIFQLFRQRADGSGTVDQLTKGPTPMWPFSISPDGTRVVLHETGPQTGADIDLLALDGKSTPTPIVRTPFNEDHGEISPDGRWLAYSSNDSGQPQIYVRPFPNVNDGHWQVSPAGGAHPVWARNGRELFYMARSAMMAVPVLTATSFSAANPTKLFEGPYLTGIPGRVFDVSLDDQKFLMIKDPQASPDVANRASIVVVLNWLEELKARLPITK